MGGDTKPVAPSAPTTIGPSASTSTTTLRKSLLSRTLALTFLPPILRPVLRAFLLGYLTSVGPQVFNLIFKAIMTSRRRKAGIATKPDGTLRQTISLSSLKREAAAAVGLTTTVPEGESWELEEDIDTGMAAVMRAKVKAAKEMAQRKRQRGEITMLVEDLKAAAIDGFSAREFPVFCAVVVGGSTMLEAPLLAAVRRMAKNISDIAATRVSRWLATFISAYAGLELLSSRKYNIPQVAVSRTPSYSPFSGQTLDLALFAATRAIDVIVGELWSRWRIRRETTGGWTKAETFISRLADPAVFAASSAAIMWSWFYSPDRLPKAYTSWITAAAAVDHRLIEALRRCRFGWLIYGEETGQAPLLQEMCADYKWPVEWGDPALTAPFPCTMVHMGYGGSCCELHMVHRFVRTWGWMMASCAPLMLALRLLRPHKNWAAVKAAIKRALISANRSSSVIAAFTAMFYYGVCLMRTRIGPRVLGRDDKTCTRIDGGLCVALGCGLCGWSILLENATKRQDLALFVAPKALGTLLPREMPEAHRWKETMAFAVSTAVVFTCVVENKKRVKGMFGRILGKIMEK